MAEKFCLVGGYRPGHSLRAKLLIVARVDEQCASSLIPAGQNQIVNRILQALVVSPVNGRGAMSDRNEQLVLLVKRVPGLGAPWQNLGVVERLAGRASGAENLC